MAKINHTPGPCQYCGTEMKNTGAPIWEDYCPDSECTGHAEAFKVAVCNAHQSWLDAERVRDAAPDLLEALKALSASIFVPSDDRSPELATALEITVSAIRKAEGQSC